MTIEEQREVAIKVVVGIFSVLAAGLFIAYVYEQMQNETEQKKPSNSASMIQQDFIVEEITPEHVSQVSHIDEEEKSELII